MFVVIIDLHNIRCTNEMMYYMTETLWRSYCLCWTVRLWVISGCADLRMWQRVKGG